MMFLEYLKMKDYLRSRGYDSWKAYYMDTNETEWRASPQVLYPSFLKDLESEESLLSKRGYFRGYKYTRNPVVRVTKSQAEDYCRWRTEMVEYAWSYFPKYADRKQYADKVQYRLPSPEELRAAQDHFSEKDQLVSIKRRNPLKYKPLENEERYTLYNISEFTSSDALYGENWKEVVPKEFPNDLTGFRCVCEVKY